jgi:hypothetical protein
MNLLKYNQIFEAGTQSSGWNYSGSNNPTYGSKGGYKSKDEVFGRETDKNEPKKLNTSIKVKISKDLEEILKKMEDNDSYLAFEMLWLGEDSSKYQNGLAISDVSVSNKDFCFEVTIDGKKYDMKIGKFFRYYWPGLLTDEEIKNFIYQYNDMVSDNIGSESITSVQRIKVPEFTYNPKDVKATFLSLTTKTYPHYGDCRHEKEVLQFLPKDLKMDEVGNYYKIIGSNPTVMFTCHLDTADSEQKTTKLFQANGRVNEEGYSFRLIKSGTGDEHIYTDGSSILGADDKAGTAVMLYMMDHNIPGLYYFFIGEERGGIGSRALSSIYSKVDYLTSIKKCVSFDRRRTTSVITHQMGRQCCSNEFGQALCDEYNKHGLDLSLDTTGVFTDSASFIDDISECTNVSVGYYNEHRGTEIQNISYLKRLAEASVKVNWDSLPARRKVGYNEELFNKHKNLINEIKKNVFGIEVKVVGKDDRIFISLDLDEPDMDEVYDALIRVQTILNKYKIIDNGFFTEAYFKIELR